MTSTSSDRDLSPDLTGVERLLDANRTREAGKLLSQLEGAQQDSARGLYLGGVIAYRNHDLDSAEERLRNSIARDASRWKAIYYLGLTLEKQERTTEALRAFSTVAQLAPEFEKVQRKLRELAPELEERRASGGATPPGEGRSIPKREFDLPLTDEDFEIYERSKRRKAKIDFWAENWHAQPLIVKLLLGMTILVFLGFWLGVLVMFLSSM